MLFQPKQPDIYQRSEHSLHR